MRKSSKSSDISEHDITIENVEQSFIPIKTRKTQRSNTSNNFFFEDKNIDGDFKDIIDMAKDKRKRDKDS